VLQSSGAFQAAGSFISELALAPGPGPEPQAAPRQELRLGSLAILSRPRQPAANELGGGPVRHVRPTELERLAGPSAPCSATPHTELALTPRISQRAERRRCMRLSPGTSLARPQCLRLRAQD